jgi:hypothetical protein
VAVRVGAGLIVLSLLGWLMIPLVPVVGFRGGAALTAAAVLVVLAEILFWLGVVLIGRQTWELARSHGWRQVPAQLWRLLRYGRRPNVES